MEKIIATELPTGIDSEILNYLEAQQTHLDLEGAIIYYGFPVFKDYEEATLKSKIAILSKRHGLILIYTSNPHDTQHDDEILTQLFSFVEPNLKKSKILRLTRTSLALNIQCILFVHNGAAPTKYETENDVLVSLEGLATFLNTSKSDVDLSGEVFDEARSIIEGSKALTKASKRIKVDEDPSTKLNILIELEKEISNFDSEQRKIAISLVNGPQRIRGLAGSGKTVVLAMKAAHIHLQYPNKKILFTFHTKSLYGQIIELIGKFYRHFAGDEPNWECINVLHSWGGKSIEGVYFRACVDNAIGFTTFPEALRASPSDPFRYVCKSMVHRDIESKYDYILIDEAQDLPTEFFQLCYKLANGKEGYQKHIVWAYDELQSIFQVYQRSPKELFGTKEDGSALIDLEAFKTRLGFGQNNDFVLHRCYRNPLEVLITAHSIGFGIYSDNPIQTLENKDHWQDLGYTVPDGENLTIGTKATVTRERKNSPLSIYTYQTPAQIIETYEAHDINAECIWITDCIKNALAEGLRPHDILVISLDDRNAKNYFSRISYLLAESKISSNNLSIPSVSAAPPFRIDNMVTLSTVHKAKGNEAAMVFAIGIDAMQHLKNTREARNKLFTAFTRTKAWLRVSGIGARAREFFNEISTSIEKSPSLEFTVLDPSIIKPIERDLSEKSSEFYKLHSAVDELIEQGITKERIQMELNLGKKE